MNQDQPTPDRRPGPDDAARRDPNEKQRGSQGGPDGKRPAGQEKAPNPQNERFGADGPVKAPAINKDDPRMQRDDKDSKNRPTQRA